MRNNSGGMLKSSTPHTTPSLWLARENSGEKVTTGAKVESVTDLKRACRNPMRYDASSRPCPLETWHGKWRPPRLLGNDTNIKYAKQWLAYQRGHGA